MQEREYHPRGLDDFRRFLRNDFRLSAIRNPIEFSKPHQWYVTGDWDSYAAPHSFGLVLEDINIPGIIDVRKTRGLPTSIIDLMSCGAVLRDQKLQVDNGLAVTLCDQRTNEEKQYDVDHNITLVVGDIIKTNTWRRITEWVNSQRIEGGVNYIFCRPIEGLSGISDNPVLHLLLLQRSYKILSSKEGMLLTTIPYISKQFLPQWTAEVNRICGSTIIIRYGSRFENPALLIVKTPGAPEKLPGIT